MVSSSSSPPSIQDGTPLLLQDGLDPFAKLALELVTSAKARRAFDLNANLWRARVEASDVLIAQHK